MATSVRSDAGDCCREPADADWGRLAGAAPPLAWWWPALAWTAGAVVLALVVVLVVRPPGPLDDPQPADQRDGLLLDGPTLPPEVGGIRFGDQPVVVLFTRDPPAGPRFDRWRAAVTDQGVRLETVLDRSPSVQALARALRLPVPVDGGPPVGYAVVDPARRLRYSTLDPAYLDNAFEVDVITGATSRDRP